LKQQTEEEQVEINRQEIKREDKGRNRVRRRDRIKSNVGLWREVSE
jgi:hypothetical protein